MESTTPKTYPLTKQYLILAAVATPILLALAIGGGFALGRITAPAVSTSQSNAPAPSPTAVIPEKDDAESTPTPTPTPSPAPVPSAPAKAKVTAENIATLNLRNQKLYAMEDGEPVEADVTNYVVTELAIAPNKDKFAFVYSTIGNGIVFGGNLGEYTLSDGFEEFILNESNSFTNLLYSPDGQYLAYSNYDKLRVLNTSTIIVQTLDMSNKLLKPSVWLSNVKFVSVSDSSGDTGPTYQLNAGGQFEEVE